MFQKKVLRDGLRIIIAPQKNSQVVTVLVLVGTGSKYERKGDNGVSHFLEHMLFKGTKKRPTPAEVSGTLDKVGGFYNAFTSQEFTGYFASVENSHFELALDWVSDMLLNSLLPQDGIEREKNVIIEEINMRYDHPITYIESVWSQLLYGDQPAGWDVAGTKETVSNMNREKIFNYFKQQYVAKNTVVCVAGNVKSKNVFSLVAKYFGGIGKSQFKPKPKVVEKQEKPGVFLHHRETDQSHIYLGLRTFSRRDPRKYVIEVIDDILGGMMSSRLFQEVREKLGLAYYISTFSYLDTDTGYLVAQAGIDNKKIDLGISAILKEYKKITAKRVSSQELKKAKDNLKGKLAISLETSNSQASFYAFQEILDQKILTPKDIYKKIDQVSAADILRVARDVFKSQRLNLALIGPFKEAQSFFKILKI